MKIGVIGAGAIGGWIARLALAGNRVAVLARGNTLQALESGLTIRERGASELAGCKPRTHRSASGHKSCW